MSLKPRLYVSLLAVSMFFIPLSGQAEEETATDDSASEVAAEDAEEMSRLRRIMVAESKEDAFEAPGSVHVIEEEELDDQLYGVDDIHRVLRQVPGVNIQEEDGLGLRPNIGVRGVANERSARITLMEDGILIAPAPYSAPSAYYFPPIGRMSGVELTKGPGQIKYGPYTTGGSLNLLSNPIPEDQSLDAKLSVGSDNLKKIYVGGGKSWKYGGVFLETYQIENDGFKDLDGGGDTGVDLEDYQLKFRLNTDPERSYYQELEYKIGFYDQQSNETYLGLTDEDFGRTPFRRYAASQLDNIDADHVQHHLTHSIELSDEIDITTQLYYNETQRNWYKIEKVAGTGVASVLQNPESFSEELAFLQGVADSPDDALALRSNQRDYESMGVQSVLGWDFSAFETEHELEVGARFHSDEEDRFQHEDDYRIENGRLVLTSEGAPGSQANRIGSADAWAFFVQDTIRVDALTLVPGVRYERINYTREDFGREDSTRSGANLKRNDTNVDSLIPGLSVKYDVNDETAVFAGIHKGFSPPGPTSQSDVEEEESINYEAGASFARNSLYTKAVLFYTDYDNLLGADTLSSGGGGTGDLFNGGEAEVLGLEFEFGYDLMEAQEAAFAVPFRMNYTFTSAEFASSFDSDFFGDVSDGDDIPYIPEHQAFASLGLEYDDYALYGEVFFSDKMTTAAGELDFPSETDSYAVFDLLAKWQYNDNVSVFGTIENLFDREYVVARRPAGARPGLPLTAVAGVELSF